MNLKAKDKELQKLLTKAKLLLKELKSEDKVVHIANYKETKETILQLLEKQKIPNTEKIIKLLARWWSNALTTEEENWDMNPTTENEKLAQLLGNLLNKQSREQITFLQIRKFERLFIEHATAYFNEYKLFPDLSVDYCPSAFLTKIANEAGISLNAFPCKTYTSIHEGRPYGKCGEKNELTIIE